MLFRRTSIARLLLAWAFSSLTTHVWSWLSTYVDSTFLDLPAHLETYFPVHRYTIRPNAHTFFSASNNPPTFFTSPHIARLRSIRTGKGSRTEKMKLATVTGILLGALTPMVTAMALTPQAQAPPQEDCATVSDALKGFDSYFGGICGSIHPELAGAITTVCCTRPINVQSMVGFTYVVAGTANFEITRNESNCIPGQVKPDPVPITREDCRSNFLWSCSHHLEFNNPPGSCVTYWIDGFKF